MRINRYESIHEFRDNVDERILKTYTYGSRVYGATTKDSDYDYIMVVKSEEDLYYSVNKPNMNITVYSEGLFIQKIKEHDISVLECIFQEKDDKYVEHFVLNKETLRRSISSVSSNSYVKCKKKLAEGQIYIGRKSLFHSIRILGFGIQIALTGRIVDYGAYNHHLKIIMGIQSDKWEDYDSIYKPIFNRYKKNLKKFAPLEKELENARD